MAEFVLHTAPWVQPPGSSGTVTPSRLHSQMRSSTLAPMTKTVTKSISTPHLSQAAQERHESDAMNTIPDPRSPTPQIHLSRNNSTDSNMHPDLSQEVATLSTKLINAINHQTTLDDSLQHTRHELDTARDQLARLEAQVKEHEEKVAKGLLVDKVVYEKMEKQLSSDLEEERKRRIDAEKAKRKTDNEVETLTAALFEEANVMVAAARKETEASEKRNDQLRQQLGDAELLQASLQEQLQDLKGVMERMSNADDESNTLPTTTAPSTPGITPADKMSKLFDAANLTPNTPGSDEISPDHPLHFTHLIHPVLRSDLTSFKEFQDMLKISSRSAPNSRVSSGNYGSLNVLGLGSLTNNSSSSLPLAKSPNSAANSPRDSVAGAGMPNLKDEKFYKRALSEDIEPTLRLDIAPGLSWMARRTVLNSITAGSLVVEPSPPPPKFRGPVFPCSLCGEARKDEKYARKFRFKTSDSDETRHPLCDWCLGRVRSTCDYIGFLRMIAAGHWRAETEDEKKIAWEESVRLRERMFWMRIGGGVVPAFVPTRESPRSPTFVNGKVDADRKSEESQVSDKPLDSAVDMTDIPKEARKSEDDPFQSKDGGAVKRVSIGKTVISNEAAPTPDLSQEEEKNIEAAAEAQLQEEVRKSVEVKTAESRLATPSHSRSASTPSSPSGLAPRKKEERLSLTIPGSFE
ncbi:Sec2p-domain-containing protein [Lentithecium fluviatile CBS 122367]|uniref:Sec2p-domain-containing protein n=1 Tax=Lentithecium fluviatile CBS 122367 TaxID=1168545 RepID=A0A6G1IML5_9PLEO|nr:Sec2p-domain-containing protein [Lentithecium fluviatile CBS 122367]